MSFTHPSQIITLIFKFFSYDCKLHLVAIIGYLPYGVFQDNTTLRPLDGDDNHKK